MGGGVGKYGGLAGIAVRGRSWDGGCRKQIVEKVFMKMIYFGVYLGINKSTFSLLYIYIMGLPL